MIIKTAQVLGQDVALILSECLLPEQLHIRPKGTKGNDGGQQAEPDFAPAPFPSYSHTKYHQAVADKEYSVNHPDGLIRSGRIEVILQGHSDEENEEERNSFDEAEYP